MSVHAGLTRLICDLKTGARLNLLIGVALLATVIVAAVGMINNKRLADSARFTYQAITRPLAAVANARGSFNAMRTSLYDLAQDFNTEEENIRFRQSVMRNLGDYEEEILLYVGILRDHGSGDPYEKEAVAYLHRQLEPLRLYVESIAGIGFQTGRGADAVLILRGEFLKTADDISRDLAALTRILEAQTNEANIYAGRLHRRNNGLSLFIAAVGALLLFTIARAIVRSITRPMEEMCRAAECFASGNLDLRLEYRAKDEIGLLADSFRGAARDLAAYLRDKETAERSAHEAELARGRAEAVAEALLSSIHYASKIQRNLRPADEVFARAFADHHIIWEPRDIVGGDIYWMKNYEAGSILCVCDCTGHGTPGALLTMLTVSALEAVVDGDNCADTALIMWRLDQRLAAVLNVGQASAESGDLLHFNDGCDIAIVFAAKDGSLRLSSSGLQIFSCDGREVHRIKGQRLGIGEGGLSGPDRVLVTDMAPNPGNKFYIASDGLYEQAGGPAGRPFGYAVFKKLILENHGRRQAVIAEEIWRAFEDYRGDQARRDDVELICFTPRTLEGVHQ